MAATYACEQMNLFSATIALLLDLSDKLYIFGIDHILFDYIFYKCSAVFSQGHSISNFFVKLIFFSVHSYSRISRLQIEFSNFIYYSSSDISFWASEMFS